MPPPRHDAHPPRMHFDRIVCGFDDPSRSLAVLDQALGLLAPGGRLVAVTARHLPRALLLGLDGTRGAAAVSEEAVEAHAAARAALAHLPNAEARLVDGDPASCLLAVAEQERARLLVVGARPHGRPTGMLVGRVDTVLLHRAACPVLVVRGPWKAGELCTIAVGFDGSPSSLLALDAAQRLARRRGARLVPIAAGEREEPARPDGVSPPVVRDPRNPVDALVAASADADLLVVGSRGLRGLAALGSVSERVAHAAECSVLVVRPLAVEEPVTEGPRLAPRPAAAA
jgi:nucleotide-binding universal stress UspA family protein